MGVGREDTVIVEHLVGMASGLGMLTVAEGVETPEQAALLADMGCQLAQGFLYSAAKEPEVVGELLAAHAPAATEEAVGGYPTWAVRPPSTARTAPVT